MSFIFHLCNFGIFITKPFYYFTLTWFCDLFLQGNSPRFGPAIWGLASDFSTKVTFCLSLYTDISLG